MPGACQNTRSAPQKQPMPTTAVSRPSGYGGFSGVPSTKCRSGTGIVSVRPGSASSGATMRVFVANKRMPYGPRRPRFVTGPLVLVVAGLGDGIEQLECGGLRRRDQHFAAQILELREEARVHCD